MSNSPRSSATCTLWRQAPPFGHRAKVRPTPTDNLSHAQTLETPVAAVIKPSEPQDLIPVTPAATATTPSTVSEADEAIKEGNDNETYLLDTNRPTKDLRADQETMLYRINPQPHSIRFNTPSGFTLANLLGNRSSDIPKPIYTGQHLTDAEIHFSSASVTGLPALGQTTVLANRALKNMKAGLSTIVLSNSKWQRHNIAQAMIDFTTQADRMSLTQRIIIINNEKDLAKIQSSPSDKVGVTYIVSTDVLKDFYSDNDDFQQLVGVLSLADLQPKQKSKHLKLGDYLPINNVSEILVDDVHEYTGYSRDGYTKILLSLLRETNSNEKNRSTLIGFSSTPYNRENKGKHPSYNTFIDYETFFPPLSQIKILSTHQESIEQNLIKSINPQQITLTGTDSSGQPIESAIRGTNRNSLLKSTETVTESRLISPDSVNAQIIKEIKAHYRPGQKWRIIASSAEHAKLLGKLLTANIPQANPKVIVGEFKGSYKVNSDETTVKNVPVYDSSAQKSLIALKEQREDEIGILGSFESNSRADQCDILIDLQILQGYHPSNVTHVVHANFSESETALLRSLGHAYRGDSDQTNIEYWFLDPAQYTRYLDYRKGNVTLADRGKTNSAPSFKEDAGSGEATTVESQINAGEALLTHEYWTQVDLHNLVNSRYPSVESFEQGLDHLADDFFNYKQDANKSKDDIKKVISGRHIDQDLFREFLNWAKINLAHVYVYAPELVGITNRQEAKETFKFAFQEMMNGGLPKEINNWHWYDYLDKHLGIVPALPREHALNLRAKKFAEIIYDKFGPKYFEDRAFIRHVIEVFNGVKTDTKLIGLLINSIPKMDMEEAMTLFPELTGYVAYMPFEKLQNMLITKYPNGPSLDLDTFFKQTIFDDLGISFATLVNSISDYHRASEQVIVNNSVKEQIAEYLTSMKATEHLHEITQQVLYNQILAKVWGINRATVITDNDFRHLVHPHKIESIVHPESPVEQAIDLENVNLDWVTYIDEAIKSKFPANELSSNLKTRLAFAINKFINEAEHHFDESLGDSKFLEQDIDTRSAFRKHQAVSTINKADNVRAIRILSGAIGADGLTNDDKKLLRTFAHSLDIDLEDLICKLSSFVGIISTQEATHIVNHALSQIDRSKFNPRLAELTSNATTNPELIAEFLFERDPDALLDRESLSTAIRLINGDETLFTDSSRKASSQAYLRSYINFLEQNKPKLNIKVSNPVTELPQLMNILNKDELVAVIKAKGYHCSDYNGTNGSPRLEDIQSTDTKDAVAKFYDPTTGKRYFNNQDRRGVIEYVTRIGIDIDKTPEEMYALAKIPNPETWYEEPAKLYSEYLATERDLPNQLSKIQGAVQSRKDEIKARDFVGEVLDYGLYSEIHIDNPKSSTNTNTRIELRIKTELFSGQEQEVIKQNKPKLGAPEYTGIDLRCYEYENNAWQEKVDFRKSFFNDAIDTAVSSAFYTNEKGVMTFLSGGNTTWCQDYLLAACAPLNKIETAKQIAKDFLHSKRSELKLSNDPTGIARVIKVILGDKSRFEEEKDPAIKQANQKLFREFVNFAQQATNNPLLDLNTIIAAHPKLTGVSNLDEIRLAALHQYPSFAEFTQSNRRPYDELAKHLGFDHIEKLRAIAETAEADQTHALPLEDMVRHGFNEGFMNLIINLKNLEDAIWGKDAETSLRVDKNIGYAVSKDDVIYCRRNSSTKNIQVAKHYQRNAAANWQVKREVGKIGIMVDQVLQNLLQHSHYATFNQRFQTLPTVRPDEFNVAFISLVEDFLTYYTTNTKEVINPGIINTLLESLVGPSSTKNFNLDKQFIVFAEAQHPGFKALVEEYQEMTNNEAVSPNQPLQESIEILTVPNETQLGKITNIQAQFVPLLERLKRMSPEKQLSDTGKALDQVIEHIQDDNKMKDAKTGTKLRFVYTRQFPEFPSANALTVEISANKIHAMINTEREDPHQVTTIKCFGFEKNADDKWVPYNSDSLALRVDPNFMRGGSSSDTVEIMLQNHLHKRNMQYTNLQTLVDTEEYLKGLVDTIVQSLTVLYPKGIQISAGQNLQDIFNIRLQSLQTPIEACLICKTIIPDFDVHLTPKLRSKITENRFILHYDIKNDCFKVILQGPAGTSPELLELRKQADGSWSPRTKTFAQLAQRVHDTFPSWEAVKSAHPNLSDPSQVNQTTYQAIIDEVLRITQRDQGALARLALIPNNLSQRYNHAMKLAKEELNISLANVNGLEEDFQRMHLLERLWPEARKDLKLLAMIKDGRANEERLALLAHNKVEVSRLDLTNPEIPRVLGYTIHRFNTDTNKWRTTITDKLENSIKTILNIWNKSDSIIANKTVLQTYRDALNITGEEIGSDMHLVILLADFLKAKLPYQMQIFEKATANERDIVEATRLIDNALRIITKTSTPIADTQLGENFMGEFINYAITQYPQSKAILETIQNIV